MSLNIYCGFSEFCCIYTIFNTFDLVLNSFQVPTYLHNQDGGEKELLRCSFIPVEVCNQVNCLLF